MSATARRVRRPASRAPRAGGTENAYPSITTYRGSSCARQREKPADAGFDAAESDCRQSPQPLRCRAAPPFDRAPLRASRSLERGRCSSDDPGPQDVAREQEAALHELLVTLEAAVLVLDRDGAVVPDRVQRREEARPVDLAQAGQARHLPADPAAQRPVPVEPVA